MKQGDYKDEFSSSFSRKQKSRFSAPSNTIAIYTVLTILLKMKKEMGLEMMLEYIEKYLASIDKRCPKYSLAVKQALSIVSVEKIFREAIYNEEEGFRD